jgi:hypothetical protein
MSDRFEELRESFSDLDRLLIGKTEEALRDGLQLEQWCRQQLPRLRAFPLDLKKKYRLPNRAEGFFAALDISGRNTSVMGCTQQVEFGRLEGERAPELDLR